MIAFISGHRTLTHAEFDAHYRPRIFKALLEECDFVVGDAPGCDAMAQAYLKDWSGRGYLFKVTVYHAGPLSRHNVGFPTNGGYVSYTAKDIAMTANSDFDIAWVRPGEEDSGTARNLARRHRKHNRAGEG
jgi:hypothetical protein